MRLDVKNNAEFAAHGKLPMPILAIGGSKSFGAKVGTQWHQYATTVQTAVLPNTGHWVTEESPVEVTRLTSAFTQ